MMSEGQTFHLTLNYNEPEQKVWRHSLNLRLFKELHHSFSKGESNKHLVAERLYSSRNVSILDLKARNHVFKMSPALLSVSLNSP